jgi:hypothetical protein
VVGCLFSFSVVLCISVFTHLVILVLLLGSRQLSAKTLKYDKLPREEDSNCPCFLFCFEVAYVWVYMSLLVGFCF